jgi:uncharacterized protein YecT (DUF1311 family)
MRPVIAAYLALALPAAAQELAFDPTPAEACFAAGGAGDCIGQAATVCSEQPGGYTTVGLGFCLGAERDWWDARLNEVYAALMAREKKIDAEMEEIGATVPRIAPSLRDMQRAWIAFRDASCAYEYSKWGGGSGGGPAHAACAMRLTAEQTVALKSRLDEVR